MLVYQSLPGIFFLILHPGFIYQKHQLLEIHDEKGAPGLTRRRCKNNMQTSPLPAVTNRGPRKVSPVELWN